MYQDGQISAAGEQLGYDIVAAVREAVGPRHEILIDAHGHYNVPTAIRLADFIMPDVIWTGGISEARKIATMAESYYIPVAPHTVPGGPIELISAAHVVSSIPNFYRLEHSQVHIPTHAEMLEEPYVIEDGHLHLNGKPGLGIEINEEWLTAHLHPDWQMS